MTTQAHDPKADVDKLNAFLRDEISSVETYKQCIEKLDRSDLVSELTTLCGSHEKRVQLLRQRVQELGGTPKEDSGVWGSFTKLVEGGAKMFGEKPAVNVLEEGEDRGKDNYLNKAEDLSPENLTFIKSSILPEHEQTHDRMSHLKHTLH